jgi:hypothetical protein
MPVQSNDLVMFERSGTAYRTTAGAIAALGGGGGGGPADALRILAADETRTNDTSVQSWFASADAMVLDADSTYAFEGFFRSTNGTTSHGLNMQFDAISGGSIQWQAIGSKVTLTAQATAQRYTMANSFDTNRNVTTASTVAGNVVNVWGVIRTGAGGGTFRPRVAQTAASGSFTILAGTMMRLRKLGADTLVNTGDWA